MLPGGIAPTTPVSGQSNNTVLISAPADAAPVSDTMELDNFWIAACYVAATVALIKQRYPQLPPALVARALAMSARYRPRGGYSPSVGFGVLDPNDAILDAGTLARLTVSAPGGADGTVAAASPLRRRTARGGQRATARRAGRLPVLGAHRPGRGAARHRCGAVGAARLPETVAGPARRLAFRSSRRTPGRTGLGPSGSVGRVPGAAGTLEAGATGALGPSAAGAVGPGAAAGHPASSGRPGGPAMSAVTATAGRRPLPFWIMIGLILLLGLGAAVGGAGGVVATATRHPSQAQISAAGQREFAVQWQRLRRRADLPVLGLLCWTRSGDGPGPRWSASPRKRHAPAPWTPRAHPSWRRQAA